MRKWIAIVAAAFVCLMSTAASAATEWIMVTGLPDSNYFIRNYMEFIKEVEQQSGGELKIKYYGNQTLVKRDAIRRALQEGQAQLGEVDFNILANENAVYQLDSIPGIGSSYSDAWALMEAQRPYVDKLYSERGLRILGFAPWGGQGFFSKSKISNFDDFKGLKLRVYSPATRSMGEVLGARPTILPAEEVPQAFASGLIDAMFTGAATGVISQTWDNTKYYLFVGAMHSKQSLVVNEAAFKALSPKVQQVLLDAGKRATERGWKLSETDDGAQMKILEQKGMTVLKAWPDLQKKMSEIGDINLEEWKKKASPEAMAVLQTYQAKVKK